MSCAGDPDGGRVGVNNVALMAAAISAALVGDLFTGAARALDPLEPRRVMAC